MAGSGFADAGSLGPGGVLSVCSFISLSPAPFSSRTSCDVLGPQGPRRVLRRQICAGQAGRKAREENMQARKMTVAAVTMFLLALGATLVLGVSSASASVTLGTWARSASTASHAEALWAGFPIDHKDDVSGSIPDPGGAHSSASIFGQYWCPEQQMYFTYGVQASATAQVGKVMTGSNNDIWTGTWFSSLSGSGSANGSGASGGSVQFENQSSTSLTGSFSVDVTEEEPVGTEVALHVWGDGGSGWSLRFVDHETGLQIEDVLTPSCTSENLALLAGDVVDFEFTHSAGGLLTGTYNDSVTFVVPEPAALSLLALGFALSLSKGGLALVRRRRAAH